ncbi:MAG: DUF2842 domain-containing protein [Rhizobiales bacterium]|nr:DUF2842 domain-containing protein [Hyphomicrobiales bacterium]
MTKLRKIIATIALVAFISVYSLGAMVFAVVLLPGTSGALQLAYYAFAGLFWVLPAGFIIWLGWRGEKAITPGQSRPTGS